MTAAAAGGCAKTPAEQSPLTSDSPHRPVVARPGCAPRMLQFRIMFIENFGENVELVAVMLSLLLFFLAVVFKLII